MAASQNFGNLEQAGSQRSFRRASQDLVTVEARHRDVISPFRHGGKGMRGRRHARRVDVLHGPGILENGCQLRGKQCHFLFGQGQSRERRDLAYVNLRRRLWHDDLDASMVEVTGVAGQLDVYLVPAGRDRHELFCEAASDEADAPAPSSSWWGRLTQSFRRAVAEGEAEQAGQTAGDDSRGRIRRAITRRIAAVVAEQRLLWRLRHQSAARLLHPDDLAGAQAIAIAREQIGADLAKHWKWCLIDALLTAITGPLFFFVPGPNVISWYFAFRAVGHYFAYRGARQGVEGVAWTACPSPLLSELRTAFEMRPDQRSAKIDAIAESLGLERLAPFLAKVADRAAS